MVNRPDRRTDNTQLRAFSASQNILNRADGSAKFEFGTLSIKTVCYKHITNSFF
jgi:exosome complex component RRP46